LGDEKSEKKPGFWELRTA